MDYMVNNHLVNCIVQARLTSTRLPNKVFLPLGIGNQSILEHVKNRMTLSTGIDNIIFAIPNTPSNDKLYDFLTENHITTFRGDEDNVLNRFYQCAKKYPAPIIIRATCDNPLVDWEIANQAISLLIESKADYILTKGFPLGSSVEIMTFQALEKAFINASKEAEFEHVTPYIYTHPDEFTIKTLYCEKDLSDYRFTVDTSEDYQFMKKIYDELYHGVPLNNKEVISYLDAHSDVKSINSKIKQKSI